MGRRFKLVCQVLDNTRSLIPYESHFNVEDMTSCLCFIISQQLSQQSRVYAFRSMVQFFNNQGTWSLQRRAWGLHNMCSLFMASCDDETNSHIKTSLECLMCIGSSSKISLVYVCKVAAKYWLNWANCIHCQNLLLNLVYRIPLWRWHSE
jgi:hypothetical protein